MRMVRNKVDIQSKHVRLNLINNTLEIILHNYILHKNDIFSWELCIKIMKLGTLRFCPLLDVEFC